MTNWLADNWVNVGIPLLVFVAVAVLGLSLRSAIRTRLTKTPQNEWVRKSFVIEALWNPFWVWFVLLGAYVAVEVSSLSSDAKKYSGEGLATLFVISLMWAAVKWAGRLIRFYIGKSEAAQSLTSVSLNVARAVIFIIGLLIIFNIWGVPTLPISLALIAGIFIVVFAFRNTLDNFLAGLEIAFSEHIKVGHLIKLGTGETGHVTKISWTRTVIQTSEGHLVIVPNYKLMTNIIVNQGAVAADTTIKYTQAAAVVGKSPVLPDALSDREREVLMLIGLGATNKEIAEKLIISEHTVKSHLRSILSKLDLRNRQQVAAYAARQGAAAESENTGKTE